MQTKTVIVAGVVIALPWLFAACDLITGPGGRVMGIIGYEAAESVSADLKHPSAGALQIQVDTMYWDLPMLEAPDTVAAGTAFEIIVRTAGPGGCWQAAGAEVSGSGLFIEVVPYDRVVGPTCADADALMSRIVELVFSEPGEGVLRITGRIVIFGDGIQDERVGSYDHPIVVR